MKKPIYLLCFLFLSGFFNQLSASSLFDKVYSEWRTSTKLTSTSASIPTYFPQAEVLFNELTGQTYIIHKNSLEKPIAVENLFFSKTDKKLRSNRTFAKQFAGMILWSLEQEDENVFLMYAKSSSVKLKTSFFQFENKEAKQLLAGFKTKKITYLFSYDEDLATLYLVDQNKDTLATFIIEPKLLDLVGNDQNHIALFFMQSLQTGILPRIDFTRNYDELFKADKGLINTIEKDKNGKIISAGFDSLYQDFEQSKELMFKWKSNSFSAADFSKDAQFSIRIVGRDTLEYNENEKFDELTIRFIHFLQANQEQSAMGLVSGKKLSENLQKYRFLMIFRNSELGYEHVVRIDQTIKKVKSGWETSNCAVLAMVANPLLAL